MNEPSDIIQNTVTIDGTQYLVESLSDKAKYCLQQVQTIQDEQQRNRAAIDRGEMALQGFFNMLREELAAMDSDDEDFDEGDE